MEGYSYNRQTCEEFKDIKICKVPSGKYSIYRNGELLPSSYEECKDLETCAVWELNHVIDRLIGDDKWNI